MQQPLADGSVLGGRFTIESLVHQGYVGHIYKAFDQKNNVPVALRVLSKRVLTAADIEVIRARVQQASALTHRNIRATYGMGVTDEVVFVALEWMDGYNLHSLLEKRLASGKRFSFKGTYNIIGHVCNALSFAHKAGTLHGALDSRNVFVTRSGRVKVHGWEVAPLRIPMAAMAGGDKAESAFWAPEVLRHPDQVTMRADIFSLGALFYNLVTGRPPLRPLRAPSKLGFSKEVDDVVARCMSADPRQRFQQPSDVKQAVAQLAKNAQVAAEPSGAVDDDLGIDIDVDFGAAEQPGPAAGPPAGDQGVPAAGPPEPGRASVIDMGAVLASAQHSDVARWMVQKDRFDHGPFSDKELVFMITNGEVLGNHKLTNMDTGERKTVREWGLFDAYLEKWRIKKQKMDEEAALQKTEKAETRGMVFKVGLAFGVLGAIALGIGVYYMSRSWRAEKQLGPDEMVAAFESGDIQVKMGTVSPRKRRGASGRKGRKRRGGGQEFVGGMSYEEAMNRAVALGDLKSSGGRVLTAADINNIMRRNVRRFLPCLSMETIRRVDMNIAVAGDGSVLGVSVQQGGSKFKRCIESKVRSIKFPESNQPRTATSWYFEVDY